MTTHHPIPINPPINWSKVAFLWAASITVAGWVFIGAQGEQRLKTLEHRTEPLAKGDLVAVQRDVSWIRERLERDAS